MPKYLSPGVSLYHSTLAASAAAAPFPPLLPVGPELFPHFLKKLIQDSIVGPVAFFKNADLVATACT